MSFKTGHLQVDGSINIDGSLFFAGTFFEPSLNLSAVNQDYLPKVGAVINIGASENRIDKIYANDVYISQSSLWVNDKKVISDESDVITVSTSPNQDLLMLTSGSGNSKVQSATGILLNITNTYTSKDIELRTDSDSGSIILNANGDSGVLFADAKGNIEIDSKSTLKLIGNSITFDSSVDMYTHGNFTIDGCLSINGNIVQNGSSYITHAENVFTTKDFITMRDGALSGLLDGSLSGIRIIKPNNTNNVILGVDNNAIMRVGWEPGILVALAGREDAPNNGYYAYWDDSSAIFKTDDLRGYIDSSLAQFIRSASTGQGLFWTDGVLDVSIESGPGASTLDSLGDVSIVSITDNQIISYNSDSSKWKNISGVNASDFFISKYDIDPQLPGNLTIQGRLNMGSGIYINKNSSTSFPSGVSNVFVGDRAGNSTTTGSRNVLVGSDAGYTNVTGADNTFAGYYAGRQVRGTGHTSIGANSGGSGALQDTNYSTAVGYYALSVNRAQNTGVGAFAGISLTFGANNTIMGAYSSYSTATSLQANSNSLFGAYSGYKNLDGSNNTYVGAFTGYDSSKGGGNVFLGYGAGGKELGSNRLYIANSSTASPLVYGEFDTNKISINGSLEASSNIKGGSFGHKINSTVGPNYQTTATIDLNNYLAENQYARVTFYNWWPGNYASGIYECWVIKEYSGVTTQFRTGEIRTLNGDGAVNNIQANKPSLDTSTGIFTYYCTNVYNGSSSYIISIVPYI